MLHLLILNALLQNFKYQLEIKLLNKLKKKCCIFLSELRIKSDILQHKFSQTVETIKSIWWFQNHHNFCWPTDTWIGWVTYKDQFFASQPWTSDHSIKTAGIHDNREKTCMHPGCTHDCKKAIKKQQETDINSKKTILLEVSLIN